MPRTTESLGASQREVTASRISQAKEAAIRTVRTPAVLLLALLGLLGGGAAHAEGNVDTAALNTLNNLNTSPQYEDDDPTEILTRSIGLMRIEPLTLAPELAPSLDVLRQEGSAPTETHTPTQDLTVTATINVRSTPEIPNASSQNLIGQFSSGDRLVVYGYARDVNGKEWYLVAKQASDENVIGWIREDTVRNFARTSNLININTSQEGDLSIQVFGTASTMKDLLNDPVANPEVNNWDLAAIQAGLRVFRERLDPSMVGGLYFSPETLNPENLTLLNPDGNVIVVERTTVQPMIDGGEITNFGGSVISFTVMGEGSQRIVIATYFEIGQVHTLLMRAGIPPYSNQPTFSPTIETGYSENMEFLPSTEKDFLLISDSSNPATALFHRTKASLAIRDGSGTEAAINDAIIYIAEGVPAGPFTVDYQNGTITFGNIIFTITFVQTAEGGAWHATRDEAAAVTSPSEINYLDSSLTDIEALAALEALPVENQITSEGLLAGNQFGVWVDGRLERITHWYGAESQFPGLAYFRSLVNSPQMTINGIHYESEIHTGYVVGKNLELFTFEGMDGNSYTTYALTVAIPILDDNGQLLGFQRHEATISGHSIAYVNIGSDRSVGGQGYINQAAEGDIFSFRRNDTAPEQGFAPGSRIAYAVVMDGGEINPPHFAAAEATQTAAQARGNNIEVDIAKYLYADYVKTR